MADAGPGGRVVLMAAYRLLITDYRLLNAGCWLPITNHCLSVTEACSLAFLRALASAGRVTSGLPDKAALRL